MEELTRIYREIWGIALPYQDKRGDEGHGEIATQYALRLLKVIPFANPRIVIPAIILHDIGWSQVSPELLMVSYTALGSELERIGRLEHQIFGADLAYRILREVDYSPRLIPEIMAIIIQHDTRKEFYSLEDSVVRDADKLWRYSQTLLETVIRNRNYNRAQAEKFIEDSAEEIDKEGFFMTGEATIIAEEDIKKLKIPEWLKE